MCLQLGLVIRLPLSDAVFDAAVQGENTHSRKNAFRRKHF